jgi:hypothetical protein
VTHTHTHTHGGIAAVCQTRGDQTGGSIVLGGVDITTLSEDRMQEPPLRPFSAACHQAACHFPLREPVTTP